jgi:hypothetical protein
MRCAVALNFRESRAERRGRGGRGGTGERGTIKRVGLGEIKKEGVRKKFEGRRY